MDKKFGSRLREVRGVLTQAKMAEFFGVKQQTYSSWERGEKECSFDDLRKIALHFGVSVDWLLGLRENAKPAAQIVASGKNSQAAGRDILAGPSAETSAEVERLRGEVAALERALAMFAPKNGGKR